MYTDTLKGCRSSPHHRSLPSVHMDTHHKGHWSQLLFCFIFPIGTTHCLIGTHRQQQLFLFPQTKENCMWPHWLVVLTGSLLMGKLNPTRQRHYGCWHGIGRWYVEAKLSCFNVALSAFLQFYKWGLLTWHTGTQPTVHTSACVRCLSFNSFPQWQWPTEGTHIILPLDNELW